MEKSRLFQVSTTKKNFTQTNAMAHKPKKQRLRKLSNPQTSDVVDHLTSSNKLIDKILGWLDKKPTKEGRNKIYFYLDDALPSWQDLMRIVTSQSLTQAHRKLELMKADILQECRQNKLLMASLSDYKMAGGEDKVPELLLDVNVLDAATSSSFTTSNNVQWRMKESSKQSVQVQMEKWTSNFAKFRDRKTYNAATVNLKLPMSEEAQRKPQTRDKDLELTEKYSKLKTAGCNTESARWDREKMPLYKAHVTKCDAKDIQHDFQLSENETPASLQVDDLPVTLVRPKTAGKLGIGESKGRERGKGRSRSRDSRSRDVRRQDNEEPAESKSLPEESGKMATRSKWKWTLAAPPPTPSISNNDDKKLGTTHKLTSPKLGTRRT